MTMVTTIRDYLRHTGMPVTVFGRQVARDPRLVRDLINGREPGTRMVARIEAFIAAHPERYR